MINKKLIMAFFLILSIAVLSGCNKEKQTIALSNGDRYFGEVKNGFADGSGTMTYNDGSKYEGNWKNEKRDGKGTFTDSDGNSYEGDWTDGNKNGEGKLIYQDGSVSEGEWKDDSLYSGNGVVYGNDGNKYVGEVKEGKYNGQGTLSNQAGPIYVGGWQNGKYNGKGNLTTNYENYAGDWQDGKKNGSGVITYEDGKQFDGQWSNDMPYTGKGTWISEEPYNYRYEGEWKEGYGKGKITYHEMNIYEGEWKDGKRQGNGTFTQNEGEPYLYSGDWKVDNEDGNGTITYTGQTRFGEHKGETYVGEWREGKPFNGQGTWLIDSSTSKYPSGLLQGEWVKGVFNGTWTYKEAGNNQIHREQIGELSKNVDNTKVINGENDSNTVSKAATFDDLFEAVKANNVEKVKELLDKKTTLIPDDPHGNSHDIMFEIAESGVSIKKDIIQLLLNAGANPNSQSDGFSVLTVAAMNGYSLLAELLISAGADINYEDFPGLTALYWAEQREHKDIIKLLKDAGAKEQ